MQQLKKLAYGINRSSAGVLPLERLVGACPFGDGLYAFASVNRQKMMNPMFVHKR